MVGYMRRLDGAYAPNSRNEKSMDPFAADGARKWKVNGSKTPLFGFWAYYAWEHVLGVVFSSSFGSRKAAHGSGSHDVSSISA